MKMGSAFKVSQATNTPPDVNLFKSINIQSYEKKLRNKGGARKIRRASEK